MKSSLRLEIGWTLVPILILLITFVLAVRVMRQTDPVPVAEAHPFVVITGHQWWWEVFYPDSGIVTANEVHLPLGKPLLIELRAADVIHDFWVPELGGKMDAIPGHPNRMWLEAVKPGTYVGACAEFCGAEHAWMRTRVIGEVDADFNAWTLAQKAANTQIDSPGSKIFQAKSCPACHVVAAATVVAGVNAGPNLSHVGDRATLAAGALDNTREGMQAWLLDPNKFKPASHMPNVQLNPGEALALTDYLESLK